jgi:hypothetical protein
MANAITNLFSKKQELVSPPALKALWAHLDTDRGIIKQSEIVAARIRQINADIKRADELQTRVQALDDSMANAEAEDRHQQRSVRDQSVERKTLADLESQLKSASETARVGRLVLDKLHADTQALARKRAELRAETDKLLRNAVIEEAASLRGEYLKARETMFAVARKVYGALLAADTICKEQRAGEFVGSGLYAELNIPLPSMFNPTPLGPEAAVRARKDDMALVSHEAEALVNTLLTEG